MSDVAADGEPMARAMALMTRFTTDITACVRNALGPELTANRTVQVVITIGRQPGATPGTVSQQLGVSRSQLSQVLHRLRSMGLVRSVRDPRDRRSLALWLTPEGDRRFAALEVGLQAWYVDRRDLILAMLRLFGETAEPRAEQQRRTALDTTLRLSAAGSDYVRAASERAAAAGVSDVNERLALGLLYAEGSMRPVQLGEALHMRSSGVAGLLNRLQEAGLIRRLDAPPVADRRATVVVLSDSGNELAVALMRLFAERADAFSGALRLAADVATNEGVA